MGDFVVMVTTNRPPQSYYRVKQLLISFLSNDMLFAWKWGTLKVPHPIKWNHFNHKASTRRPIRGYKRKEKAVARLLGVELQFTDFHVLNITEG